MKTMPCLVSLLLVAACGGGAKHPKTTSPEPDTEPGDTVEPIADQTPAEPESEPEPPPPPPKQWSATVELDPVKGSKVKRATLRFSQTEGEAARIASDAPLEGLRPGTYQLVLHQGAECGKNATKAGAPWQETTGAVPALQVKKGTPVAIEHSDLELALDGEQSILGHALVLHADKKGKPGKALACGVIAPEQATESDE